MEIKILGSGCPRCRELEKRTREVLANSGFKAHVIKVQDYAEIMKYNVMATPALVIDEVVESKGRIPSEEELQRMLIRHLA